MAKQIATKLTDDREKVLAQLLNGESLVPETIKGFACSASTLIEFCTSLRQRFLAQGARQVGGLNNHYDGVLLCEADRMVRYELKHCDKVILPEALEWCPWEGGVQFAQSQFKAKKAATFLDGMGMYRAWFDERITAFLSKHPELELGGAVSFADYYKQSSSIDGHKKDTPAAKLLQALRASKSLQTELQQEWLRFEETWITANRLLEAPFEAYVRDLIEQKDLWIHISKSGAAAIEGFRVESVMFKEVAKKRDGGCVFNYTMRLQKKSSPADGEKRDVPIQFKFTWKNGGQAIQNLNFLLVSA